MNFDVDFMDGLVLAALVSAHAPFVVSDIIEFNVHMELDTLCYSSKVSGEKNRPASSDELQRFSIEFRKSKSSSTIVFIFKVVNVGSGCPISRARDSCYKRTTI